MIPNLIKDFRKEFPHEFVRGMNTRDANLILGDVAESAPANWEFGAEKQDPLHVLVLLYGKTARELRSLYDIVCGSYEFVSGLRKVVEHDSSIDPGDETEPFGFRDGISQPPIQGLLGRSASSEYPINTGEFVLGYENELGLLGRIPSLDNWADPGGCLASHPSLPDRRGFGLNGTYLVYRKLVQRVDKFQEYINGTSTDPNECEMNAAKMVGRWRSGAPLVFSPHSPGSEPRNDFLFMNTDPDGLVCPIGSHIRRANPRDSLDMPPGRSVLVSRRHRIIRRARKFSQPPRSFSLNNPMYEQGLYFIALNADLRRQYEFVQQLWIDDPSFNGLDNDRDPLVGDNSTGGEFTIQAKPSNRHLRGLPRFVLMRGGGYFFLPGIRAIRFLANFRP